MYNKEKTEILYALSTLKNVIEESDCSFKKEKDEQIELVTIKQGLALIKGLSEYSLRKIILQGKIPCTRAGEGKHGKILISKADLIQYFSNLDKK